MALKNIFATAGDQIKSFFQGETSARRHLTCASFSDSTTCIKDGTRVEYFLRSQPLGNDRHDVKLLARGNGMGTILQPPFLGVRRYHVSDVGVMSTAFKDLKIRDFNEGRKLDHIIDTRDAFLMHLVDADNRERESRRPAEGFPMFPA